MGSHQTRLAPGITGEAAPVRTHLTQLLKHLPPIQRAIMVRDIPALQARCKCLAELFL